MSPGIADVRWFNGGAGCVGVVKVIDVYDRIWYYVGIAQGDDDEQDAMHIAASGARFPKKAGEAVFNNAPSLQEQFFREMADEHIRTCQVADCIVCANVKG